MGRIKDAFLGLWGKSEEQLEDEVREQEENIAERHDELRTVRRQQRKARLEYLLEVRRGQGR